ncbi:hypothetical protein JMA_44430 (plasmid) [Jeotgalibacillus malaysiensis]|uniref:Uncharacterized protein n=1 Tax=Jeotgalibacillus malaysiensis TaxID=1508404 RepID=A0A0B5AU66_9BACL|nr:hypothetical protein [Jeotgalibacillus malaysiensis]AJD93760.1 hypothetical protein JMA_44430 [Jeotgalibacillus malaysiensis]
MVYVVLRKIRFERFVVNELVNIWMDEVDAMKEVKRLQELGHSAFYVKEPIQ